MPISDHWDVILPVHTSNDITAPQKTLGVPDLLLEMDGPGDNVAFLILEVAVSQKEEKLMEKMRGFATECKSVQVISIIDVCESQPYRRLNDVSDLVVAMEGRDVLTQGQWKVASDDPAFGSVMSSVPYHWVRPLTIKVKAWLRHPDGEFSLDETNSSYYACAVSPYYSFLN